MSVRFGGIKSWCIASQFKIASFPRKLYPLHSEDRFVEVLSNILKGNLFLNSWLVCHRWKGRLEGSGYCWRDCEAFEAGGEEAGNSTKLQHRETPASKIQAKPQAPSSWVCCTPRDAVFLSMWHCFMKLKVNAHQIQIMPLFLHDMKVLWKVCGEVPFKDMFMLAWHHLICMHGFLKYSFSMDCLE